MDERDCAFCLEHLDKDDNYVPLCEEKHVLLCKTCSDRNRDELRFKCPVCLDRKERIIRARQLQEVVRIERERVARVERMERALQVRIVNLLGGPRDEARTLRNEYKIILDRDRARRENDKIERERSEMRRRQIKERLGQLREMI